MGQRSQLTYTLEDLRLKIGKLDECIEIINSWFPKDEQENDTDTLKENMENIKNYLHCVQYLIEDHSTMVQTPRCRQAKIYLKKGKIVKVIVGDTLCFSGGELIVGGKGEAFCFSDGQISIGIHNEE